MRGMNCGYAGWKGVVLASLLGILVLAGLLAAGVSAAALSAVAIGTVIALAIHCGTHGSGGAPCFPRRRR
jgi:hypothetical protein